MTEYEQLSAAIESRIATDPQLRTLRKKITQGTATLAESSKYSQICAQIMGQKLSEQVLGLSDREGVCTQLLHDRYNDTNQVCEQVMRSADERAGIAMNPRHAAFPAERVQQLVHSLVDPNADDETIQRRANTGAANVAISFHDDFVDENASFRSDAGYECYITRVVGGASCPWCSGMAGRYKYDEMPGDMFKRHDNCTCTVTFEQGSFRQDVWSKRSWEAPATGAGAEPPKVFSKEEADRLEQEHLAQIRGLKFNNSSIDIPEGNGIIESERMAVPNKIKWPKKGTDLSSEQIRELKEYAQNKGILLTGLKRTDVDIELMKETLDDASRMLELYPELNNNQNMPFTLKVVNGLDSNTFAQTNRYTTTNVIQLNVNAYRSKEALEREYQKLVDDKWFPQGTDYHSIISHEIGHMYARRSGIDVMEVISEMTGINVVTDENLSVIETFLVDNLSKYSVSGHSLTSEVIPEVFNAFYNPNCTNMFAVQFMENIKKGG